jgi:hypothetical protein
MLTIAGLRARLPGTLALLLIAAVIAAGILAGRSWLAAHDAAVHLAATLEAQSKILAQANERQRQRDAALATALGQIKAAKRRVDSPPKAAAENPPGAAASAGAGTPTNPPSDSSIAGTSRCRNSPPSRPQAHLRLPARLPCLSGIFGSHS